VTVNLERLGTELRHTPKLRVREAEERERRLAAREDREWKLAKRREKAKGIPVGRLTFTADGVPQVETVWLRRLDRP
jgi:hypothetical protein